MKNKIIYFLISTEKYFGIPQIMNLIILTAILKILQKTLLNLNVCPHYSCFMLTIDTKENYLKLL